MKSVALIFPGQGAQKVGMGRDLYDNIPAAKGIFDKADEILGFPLSRTIFEGPEDQLMSTACCQPAIFTMSMAALEAFRWSDKFKNVSVKYTAGLSLGEYGALHAAGALSFEETLRLIQKRGAFMEEAAKIHPGKMAAVIGFDQAQLVTICQTAGCEIANFNSPDQIVITGHAAAVEKACQMVMAAGGKKVFPLDVSGAFHSSLMKPAADRFADALKNVNFTVTDIKVITNVNGRPEMTPDEIRGNLSKQICSSVQWVDSVGFIAAEGITDFVEIGPGRVLKGLIRKIDPAIQVHTVQSAEDLAALPF
ncbi:MAG: ACP S-malonyltransferase [Candidatus Omnitrophica bacterium]|nr:ACP S-malonyltransferase [Candidatus Omnitrophota bacterium]